MIKLLLVDDHQILIDGISAILRQEKEIDVVATANSGREAIELLDTVTPDIVILDYQMPEMNGFAVIKEIQSRRPGTRIIMLSFSDNPEQIYSAMAAGAMGYVIKDRSKGALISAIHSVYNGSRYIPNIPIPTGTGRRAVSKSPEVLTRKQKEILCLYAGKDMTARDIAEHLSISITTVKGHLDNIRKRLELHRRAELMRYVQQHNFTEYGCW